MGVPRRDQPDLPYGVVVQYAEGGDAARSRDPEQSTREAEMERVAQCNCGSLRAILMGDPQRVYVCHCQACQRRTGSIMHTGAYCKKTNVRTEGVNHVYVRQAQRGRTVRFHFCPTCGSSVYWEADHSPELCAFAVGCLADPNFPPPTYSVWEESSAHWTLLPASVQERYQQRPSWASDRSIPSDAT